MKAHSTRQARVVRGDDVDIRELDFRVGVRRWWVRVGVWIIGLGSGLGFGLKDYRIRVYALALDAGCPQPLSQKPRGHLGAVATYS